VGMAKRGLVWGCDVEIKVGVGVVVDVVVGGVA
jgi:hypothetical protein